MARSPFSKPARPSLGKVAVRSPRSPSPKTNQRPHAVGGAQKSTGTTPGFKKTIVTTDAKRSVSPRSVPAVKQPK